jgi:hypothetical protein
MRGEESRERSRVQGANRIGVKAFIRERDDVGNAKNLESRGGEAIAQQFDRRQRQDEIANGSAADNEDPVQLNNG